MKVCDAMSKEVRLISANDTVQKAAQMMAEGDIGFLPVEDSDRLIGMITDRDIVTRCVAQGKMDGARVRDAMTQDVKYIFEDDDLDEALDNMADNQVRRMPVMNREKRLVGILSLGDAARQHSRKTGKAFAGVVQPGGQHSGDQMSRFSATQ